MLGIEQGTSVQMIGLETAEVFVCGGEALVGVDVEVLEDFEVDLAGEGDEGWHFRLFWLLRLVMPQQQQSWLVEKDKSRLQG